MRRTLAIASALLILGLFGRPAAGQSQAGAQRDSAQELFKRGLEQYEAREFEAAIALFDRAYALDSRPEYLFAMAQAERLSGDCRSALILYQRFLDSGPPAAHARLARDGRQKCKRALASHSSLATPLETPTHAAPPTLSSPLAPTGPGGDPREREHGGGGRWYRDRLGGALLGAGVVGLAVGGVYFARARTDSGAARNAGVYDEYVRLMDRAESRNRVAWLGAGIGGALTVAAAIRYWRVAGQRDGSTAIAVSGDGGGFGLVVVGDF